MLCLSLDLDGRRRFHPLTNGRLTVGRGSDNDVVVDSLSVSWSHALVTVTPDGLRIEDLGSRNGTWLEGRRIHSELVQTPASFRLGRQLRAIVSDVAAEDLELAPEVDVASRERSAKDSSPTNPEGRTEPAVLSLSDADVAAKLLCALAGERGEEAVQAVLTTSIEALGLEVGWLLRFTGIEASGEAQPPVVECAAGPVSELPETVLESLRSALGRGATRGASLARPADHLWVADRDQEGASVLLIMGTPPSALSLEPLEHALRVAMAGRQPRPRPREPRPERLAFTPELPDRKVIPGVAPILRRLHERMAGALTSSLPVLLVGETGVGKEVYARAIHAQSRRAEAPMRTVNSSAIPEQLLEAILFGAEEGAATGVRRQLGLLREADGGTFFLDEIGEMSTGLQAKLLRALDQGEVLPVGARAPVPVDLRFIAATNRDLAAEVEAGRFRRDLYYRLQGHVFRLPALRERREDIPALVNAFLSDECARAGRYLPGMTVKALSALVQHDWPGNVRELEVTVRRLVHELPEGEPVRHDALPSAIRNTRAPNVLSGTLDERIDAFQRPVIARVLEETQGSRKKAAERLAVSRTRLRGLTSDRLGIQAP